MKIIAILVKYQFSIAVWTGIRKHNPHHNHLTIFFTSDDGMSDFLWNICVHWLLNFRIVLSGSWVPVHICKPNYTERRKKPANYWQLESTNYNLLPIRSQIGLIEFTAHSLPLFPLERSLFLDVLFTWLTLFTLLCLKFCRSVIKK